jgi:hypothetical protein
LTFEFFISRIWIYFFWEFCVFIEFLFHILHYLLHFS